MRPSSATRWTERAATPAEARAAEALRALRGEPDLDDVALARIHGRLKEAARPWRRRRLRWKPALVGLMTLGVGGIAAATIGAVVVTARKQATEPPPVSAPEKPRPAKPRGPTLVRPETPVPEAPAAPEVPPPPLEQSRKEQSWTSEAPPAAAPRMAPRPERIRPIEPPPPPARGQDGEEVRLFTTAMRAWRSGDARGALAGVEDYQNLYPGGHFAPEALVVKVDALQALGRSQEALEFLRYLSLDRLPRSNELRLIRGELAAGAGLCDEAVVDFDLVLRREPRGPLGARALYARASCRARLGDGAGAESDLRLYLLRHPGGAHVSEVRRALTSSGIR